MTTEPSHENTNDSDGIHAVQVLERFRVAPAPPPAASTAEVTLELTYFDVLYLMLPPVQRLFLYRLPEDSNSHERFRVFHLPRLKCALAHALALFYPLAGRLVKTDPDAIPFVRYQDGDSVEVAVVESQDDFEKIAADKPKEAARFHTLVPTLSPSQQEEKLPVLAVQVTLFTGKDDSCRSGVALGVTVNHGVVDGSSSTHFVKTWAALCRQLLHGSQDVDDQGSGAIDVNGAAGVLPIFDRSIVQDPKGLREIYFAEIPRVLKHMESVMPAPTPGELLRATFSLSRADLDALRRQATPPPGTRYSSFTVACALTWVCAIKARRNLDEPERVFSFATNLRSRIRPPLPAAYFGNCLGLALAPAKTVDLVGDDGLAVAAAAIWKGVEDQHDGGLFMRLGDNLFKEMLGWNWMDSLSVAGSPSLRVYEVDFGWGRPVKVEVVSSENTGGISLAETSDARGGIEVGVPLPREAMPEFVRLWNSALQVARRLI